MINRVILPDPPANEYGCSRCQKRFKKVGALLPEPVYCDACVQSIRRHELFIDFGWAWQSFDISPKDAHKKLLFITIDKTIFIDTWENVGGVELYKGSEITHWLSIPDLPKTENK